MAAVPASPALPGPSASVSSPDLPAAVQELIPKMQLQVLVYSEVPAERLVFINNHKYVEGQAIDENVVVERITADGAVLNYQGTRFVLTRQ
jgi:hypothetical protein